MKNAGDLLSPLWLQPLLGLIQQGDFAEASALVEYFPNSPGRQLVQCAALLAQEQWTKADALVSAFSPNIGSLAPVFAEIVEKTEIDLLQTARKAIRGGRLYVGYLCLEALLHSHPEASQATAEDMFELTLQALNKGNKDKELNHALLERAIELDRSPARLLKWIERLMALYQGLQDTFYLQKAESFLDMLAPAGSLATPEYVRAALLIGRLSRNLEKYVEPLAKIELATSLALDVVRALTENGTGAYDLVTAFLSQAQRDSDALQKREIILAFIRLGELAREHGQIEQYEAFFLRALDLSVSLEGFLAHKASWPGILPQIVFSLNHAAVISRARWYQEGDELVFFLDEFAKLSAIQARQTLFAVFDAMPQASRNPFTISWLGSVLSAALSLTLTLTQDDVKRIEQHITMLPAALQDIIRQQLSQQHVLVIREELPPQKEEERGWGPRSSDIWAPPRSQDWKRYPDTPGSHPSFPQPAPLEGLEGLPAPGWFRLGGSREKEEKGSTSIPIKPVKKGTGTHIERHTRVDFPTECLLERRVDLTIQLTRSVPPATRILEKLRIAVGAEEKQTTLDVQITAANFALQQSHQQLVLPLDGDSEELTFTLVPLATGPQIIEIEFFHGASRIGYLLVKTLVNKWTPFVQAAKNVLSMEDPIVGLQQDPPPGKALPQRTLHVSWLEHEGKLYYTIYSENPDEFGEWEHHGPDTKEQITEYLRELNALLTEVVTQGNPPEDAWESILLNLQSVCKYLFTLLIPPEVAQVMQKWEAGSSVIISTNEQWIPWEILYDGQSFWGEHFILARHPRISDRRSLPATDRPQGSETGKFRKIVNVVGGEIPASEAQRAAQLFDAFPTESVTLLREAPIAALQKVLPGADALHCTCHGYLEPHMLRIARDKSRVQNLLPETIQTLSLEAGCFVFANACASTVPVLTFGKFSSFGWEFYRRGASVFVGTLGAIPTKYAVRFAESIYRELLRTDVQQTIGQSVAAAKRKAAQEHNLFWLLYCIYGDPDFLIKAP